MIISDTSSISNLFQIGKIELLKDLYGTIVITPTVQRKLIGSVKEEVELLRAKGFRLNQRLIEGVLKRLGEL